MNRNYTTRRMLALAVAALAGLMLAAPIRAHEPRRDHRGQERHEQQARRAHRHAYRYTHPVPRYAPAPVLVVPRRIAIRETARYRPYLYDRVWHADHRHADLVYRFPVSTGHGVVYRSYVYCDGDLLVNGGIAYRGGHVRLNIRF